ncbi:MAG TPA: hypothetical protein VN036_07005 [Devosia sp.]|nr:hypothetical protein [Devosia sp.]
MLALLAMAGSVVAALVVGLYLSISAGGGEAPDWRSAPGERQ